MVPGGNGAAQLVARERAKVPSVLQPDALHEMRRARARFILHRPPLWQSIGRQSFVVMTLKSIIALGLLLAIPRAHCADVYEIQVNQETHKFAIDAATALGFDFSPDKFHPLFGSGEINFMLHGQKQTLKFELTKENLYQVWHDKTELRLLFHDESSFQYDKVYGDDLTLRIIATSKDGITYEGKYSLELDQIGLKNKAKLEGVVKFTRSFRYHE
ncbi:hypothetical protein [Prosthecobacter sp.]|uniref:hypothetical protein n=1 Tax=Prosthecobacter sp. TaxID=1965333 RepID=UPI0037850455